MRARVAVATIVAALAWMGLAACGFGVDLDGVFGGAAEGGLPGDGSLDVGSDAQADATIPTLPVDQVSLGSNFGCARRTDGTVMCWGQTQYGDELGDGLRVSSSTPVLVKDVADAIDVGVGQHHGCAVRRAGTVACWGYNEYRQLGDGTTTNSPTPKTVIALTEAQHVVAGGAHSCALKKDGTVHCWGDDRGSQLGDNMTTPRSQPAPVAGVVGATQIAAGYATTCALVKSGEVFCWGKNDVGQAGAPPPDDVKVATKVAGLTGVVSIAASADAAHFCAVTQAGKVSCWGAGGNGELGDAKGQDSATPVTVLGIDDAAGVTAGSRHSCAWRKGGTVACWGRNDWRQLGLGDSTPGGPNLSTPLPVVQLTGVKLVVAGASHTCALATDGTHLSCWGTNVGGTLGRGTVVASAVPLKVMASAPIARIGMGVYHACAVDTSGGVMCWGDNGYRQIGVDTLRGTGTPIAVPGVSGATQVAGDVHTCARVAGGQIRCWGAGGTGQLGNGQFPYAQLPPVVFATSSASDVGAGYSFTCALLNSTDVACAGRNEDLRLGFSGSSTATPGIVQNLAGTDAGGGGEGGAPPAGATKLSVGRFHSCVIRAGGVVSCWGSNSGGECGVQPGGPTAPVDVSLPPAATDVASGAGHTCALLSDGSVRCWGYNSYGQLTGGAPTGPALRQPDLRGQKAKGIIAGDDHSCALLVDGTALCWGKGSRGQLGNGFFADATTPVVVKGLAKGQSLAARGNRTCAVLEDGTGYCWGENENGELGDGSVMVTGTPGAVVGY